MAYAYQALDDLMGGNQGQQKQNIFAQPGQQAGNNDVASDNAVKTSAEGDIGQTGTSGGTLTGPANAPTVQSSGGGAQASSKTAQAAYNANKGKTQTPDTFKNLQTQIGTAQSGLEKQAQDYAAAQAASHNYAVDQGTAQKAIEDTNATDARGQLGALLGRGTADQVDEFDPTGVKVNTDLLNTNAGIKELVGQGRRPTYNTGMAAFDAMLLQQDPAFQAQVAQTKAQNAALQKNVASTVDNSEKAALDAANQNLATSQSDIKNYLLGYQGNITAEEQAAAAAANAALPGQIAAAKAQAQADLEAQQRKRAQTALDATFGTGRASSQLANQAIDPSQYIDFLQGYDPTGSQFVNQTQAERFNRIQSLLGNGGATQVAAGDLPSLYTTRGDELYNQLVGGATQARQTQDLASNKAMADLQAQADKTAAADNARRLGLTQSYGNDVTSLANQLLQQSVKGDVGLQGSGLVGGIPKSLQDSLNASLQQYLKSNPASGYNTLSNPQLTGAETYTKDQANQLNALARDLGMPEIYQAGQYSKGGAQSLINQKQIQDLVNNAVGGYRNEQAAKQAEADKQNAALYWLQNNKLFGNKPSSDLAGNVLGALGNTGVEATNNPLSVIRNPNPFSRI